MNFIVRKFKRRKAYSSFRDSIWGDDQAYMQSISKFNKGIKYLLCAIDLFSKYVWLVPLKDRRAITTVIAFEKIISKSRKAKSDANQLKYGWMKEMNFIKIFLRD